MTPEPFSLHVPDEVLDDLRERLDAARRAAIRASLIGEGASPETADAWIAAWEAQAAEDGLERGSAYWDAGWDWIAEQRERRVRP